MNTDERQAAAARVLTEHFPRCIVAPLWCRCGKPWNPLHQARMLDAAGLLCASHEVTS